jgi:hypothetical protein
MLRNRLGVAHIAGKLAVVEQRADLATSGNLDLAEHFEEKVFIINNRRSLEYKPENHDTG